MYAIALLRYRRPLEEVLTVTDAHRAYLLGLKERGRRWTGSGMRIRTPKPEWCSTSCCRGRRTWGRKGWSGCR